eukprot:6195752-Pleurochrysis_carterae.AAC.2
MGETRSLCLFALCCAHPLEFRAFPPKAAEINLRRGAKTNAGGRSVAQPSNTSAGCEQAKAVELVQLAAQMEGLKEAEALMMLAVTKKRQKCIT